MALTLSSTDLIFSGPALPEAFVQHELEAALGKVGVCYRPVYLDTGEPDSSEGCAFQFAAI